MVVVSLDTEVIMIAILLMTPVYGYLHAMNRTISKFTTIVNNCKFCNHADVKKPKVKRYDINNDESFQEE